MAITPLEKICPRCQKHFFGRKNKVFCSETCRVDANNEKLMLDYHAMRGGTFTPTNKPNNVNNPSKKPVNKANYPNNLAGSKTHYTDKESELLAQNRKQQEEIEQLKQALAARTAPLQHSDVSDHTNLGNKPSNSPDSLKAAKISAMKAKVIAAKGLLEKEAEERALAERIAVAKVKAKELIGKFKAEDEAKAERRATTKSNKLKRKSHD